MFKINIFWQADPAIRLLKYGILKAEIA